MITAKMSPWFSLVFRFSNFQVWSRIGWVQVGLGRQQGQGERDVVGRSGKQEEGVGKGRIINGRVIFRKCQDGMSWD